jgi:monovalent cation/hydrogen antiporter
MIIGILGAVVLSSFLSRLMPRISMPLVQIALGVALALLPVFPTVTLDPQLFMVLFIAPLLYLEAHEIDKHMLYSTLRYSLPMAIGLVLGSMALVGLMMHAVWPAIPLAAACALGAALGPTDAVAVSSMGKSTAFTKEQKGILEGESLFNDASGVVSFQFAILAATTGAFSLEDASREFLFSFVGGIAFGVVAGIPTNWIFRFARRMGWETMTTRILVELFLPFIVFLGADDFAHVSGILAVVAFGLTVHFDHTGLSPNTARTNIVSASVWSVLSFALNGTVFILLGMQLPGAMLTSWNESDANRGMLAGTILLVAAATIAIRFLWIWLITAPVNKNEQSGTAGMRRPRSLRDTAVLTFGGAKGTISLALMFTIPYTVSSGAAFPKRNELIFIAAGVIVVTLLLANFLLPWLAPKNDKEETSKFDEVNIEVLNRTVAELSEDVTEENRAVLLPIIDSYNVRISRIKQRQGTFEADTFERLQLDALKWEKNYVRDRLADARANTDMDEHARSLEIEACERMLDQIMNILRHTSNEKGRRNAVSQIRGRYHAMHRQVSAIARKTLHRIRRSTPMLSENEIYEYLRSVQIGAIDHVIAQLYRTMRGDEYPTEYCTMLLRDYQRSRARLSSRDDIVDRVKMAPKIDEAKRESYSIELGVIQDMLGNGEITRNQAKHLRRNVYVMQVDAESGM